LEKEEPNGKKCVVERAKSVSNNVIENYCKCLSNIKKDDKKGIVGSR